eukprot:scaffold14885_cov65-Phaeocystis_antarctica.AAC.11
MHPFWSMRVRPSPASQARHDEPPPVLKRFGTAYRAPTRSPNCASEGGLGLTSASMRFVPTALTCL